MNRPHTSPYGASKAALEMATEVWVKEVEGTGLPVNIVNPGAGAHTPGIADEMRAMSREGRAPRLVEPDEMAPPLLYVVSREADSVNGWRFDANLWDTSLAPAQPRAAPAAPPASNCTRSRVDQTRAQPCIASSVTAIPEVGGALCKYFDPFDVEDGYRVVFDVLADRPALVAWTKRVRSEFRPKTWKDFSEEVFGVVQRFGRDTKLDKVGNNCILETSEVAIFGNDPLAQLDAKKRRLITARMTRMLGWHGLEPWGCWAAKRRATLRIITRMAPGTDAVVYLHLKTPDHDDSADCTITVNQTMTFIDDLGSVPLWCTAPGQVGEHGIIDIVLLSGRGFFHRHGRELYVGILGIAVAPANDAAARFELLARIVRGGVPQPEVTRYLEGASEALQAN